MMPVVIPNSKYPRTLAQARPSVSRPKINSGDPSYDDNNTNSEEEGTDIPKRIKGDADAVAKVGEARTVPKAVLFADLGLPSRSLAFLLAQATLPQYQSTEHGRCLRAIYLERLRVRNKDVPDEEWVPVSPNIRLEDGLRSQDPELVEKCRKLLAKTPSKTLSQTRGRSSKKAKLDMNSIFYNRARAVEFAAESLLKLQNKARAIYEAIRDFQAEARKHNGILIVHGLEVEGEECPVIPTMPDLGFDFAAFARLKVASGSAAVASGSASGPQPKSEEEEDELE